MYIASVATCLPAHRYEQDELIAAFQEHWAKKHHNVKRLARFHEAVEVGARHLTLPLEDYPTLTLKGANDAFIDAGTTLGAKAIVDALSEVSLAPEDVDAIFTTTVTGIATPSLDARLVNRIGLRTNVKRTPMFGLGCVAGAAGAARLHDYLSGHPDDVAILLSVELCSLTLQRGDFSIANLVASGLFGDGAACLVGVGARRAAELGLTGPKIRATRSRFYPDTERVMGWDVSDTGFQIVLAASVPDVVRAHIRDDVDAFLDAQGLTRTDITSWVCHPGGPKVLEAFEDSLMLPREALQLTWDSLRNVGNLSSASVLFVLRDTMTKRRPPADSMGLLIAMGPGFCSELVLLEW